MIEISFGIRTRVRPRNQVLGGSAHWRHLVNTIEPACAVVARRYAKLLWPLVLFWVLRYIFGMREERHFKSGTLTDRDQCQRMHGRLPPNGMFRDTWLLFVMAALCNRAGHYIFALWFLSFFLSIFFSTPNRSRRRLDVYHTLTHGVAIVQT